jgi:hypothetical protein
MKTKSFRQVGSLHPILFFAVVYVVALVLSVFICSSLFYSCNATGGQAVNTEAAPQKNPETKSSGLTVAIVKR